VVRDIKGIEALAGIEGVAWSYLVFETMVLKELGFDILVLIGP
jgi:hypothetical protein